MKQSLHSPTDQDTIVSVEWPKVQSRDHNEGAPSASVPNKPKYDLHCPHLRSDRRVSMSPVRPIPKTTVRRG